MKNLEEQLNKLKKISLSHDEREALRGRITEFIQFKPVRNSRDSRLIITGGERKDFWLKDLIFRNRMASILVALCVALPVGGGASYAAEGTVPGDALYPVKVHVNEKVKSFIAVSDE